jgi:hypothetical protein
MDGLLFGSLTSYTCDYLAPTRIQKSQLTWAVSSLSFGVGTWKPLPKGQLFSHKHEQSEHFPFYSPLGKVYKQGWKILN